MDDLVCDIVDQEARLSKTEGVPEESAQRELLVGWACPAPASNTAYIVRFAGTHLVPAPSQDKMGPLYVNLAALKIALTIESAWLVGGTVSVAST